MGRDAHRLAARRAVDLPQMFNFAPRVLLFSGKREDPGDEVRYFMDLGKGPKHDCNVWIWSVKVND